jgi:hypothetical protein
MAKPADESSRRSVTRGVVCGVIVGLLLVIVAGVSWTLDGRRRAREWQQQQRPELLQAGANAEPLIAALRAYRADYGEAPERLGQLVPQYTTRVPRPASLFQSREWQYARAPLPAGDPREFELYAYVPHDYCALQRRSFGHFSDCFVYRSDRTYPADAYGGVLERIGDWGYYHE